MTEQQYIQAHSSMFGSPDESIIEAQTVKIVVVKKAHTCMCPANTKHGGQFHEIKPGEKAVCDRAICRWHMGSELYMLTLLRVLGKPHLELWQILHCLRGADEGEGSTMKSSESEHAQYLIGEILI